MTDKPEPGSDEQLFKLRPDADRVMRERLQKDEERLRIEQNRVETMPTLDDPGKTFQARPPAIEDEGHERGS